MVRDARIIDQDVEVTEVGFDLCRCARNGGSISDIEVQEARVEAFRDKFSDGFFAERLIFFTGDCTEESALSLAGVPAPDGTAISRLSA